MIERIHYRIGLNEIHKKKLKLKANYENDDDDVHVDV